MTKSWKGVALAVMLAAGLAAGSGAQTPNGGVAAGATAVGVATNAPEDVLPEFRLPRIFGDNMVLQREQPVPVWGWSAPGDRVKVTFAGQTGTATADAEGKWSLALKAMVAGGPYELSVSGKSNIVFRNVFVGEVWLCSGQSNMEFPLKTALSGLAREMKGKGDLIATQELARAYHEAKATLAGLKELTIRFITVPEIKMQDPKYKQAQTDIPAANWVVCDEKSAMDFSGVALYYGAELARELKVPVGLVCSAFGGTGIGMWGPALEIKQGRQVIRRPDGSLYNGMVRPLIPYAMRGVIWYQGEADSLGRNAIYRECLEGLIGGWRRAWGQGDFPFYYVQIAPYSGYYMQGWFWERQAAVRTFTNCGMVVTTDLPCNPDIHPPNKQPVGHRLALWALAKTYGRNQLDYSSPFYRSFAVEGDKIRVFFDYTAGGLASRDGKPIREVTIAGEDKKFVPAKAEIEGETLVVSSEQVPKPVAVRFAYHNGTFTVNLMNKAGLPAPAFRTDTW